MGALAGIRVADFGRFVAGPWAAQLMRGMGADVVRFERPSGAEDRGLFPVGARAVSAFLVHANRGKRMVTLNPTSDGGRAVVGRIIEWADVIIANVPDSTLASMGLDWATVHERNPRTILATVTAFGTTGPYAGRLGFDGIAQVMSGGAHLGGLPGQPMKAFVPWVDYMTATNLAFGVVSALLERHSTGTGVRVEGSLLATALNGTGHVLAEEAVEHLDRPGLGNRHPAAGPADLLRTRDGYVIVQVVGNPIFARFVKAIGRVELLDDPRFADDVSRGVNGEALSEILGEWCQARSSAEVLDELAALGIPAGPLYSPRQALSDPHIQATMLEPIEIDGVDDPVPMVRLPLRGPSLDDTPVTLAPLGAHTDEVLAELGFAPAEVDELRAARAV
jgi:crotonobetainyl-CoA:carnitine CoA-transferase CaiB-like acyl-CoA transferase